MTVITNEGENWSIVKLALGGSTVTLSPNTTDGANVVSRRLDALGVAVSCKVMVKPVNTNDDAAGVRIVLVVTDGAKVSNDRLVVVGVIVSLSVGANASNVSIVVDG